MKCAAIQPEFKAFTTALRRCRLCDGDMPNSPNPIFQLSPDARILIASQAPGNKAHLSGTPFDDPSGDRLRDWLQVDRETFYDPAAFAIAPMGFCFPGYDKNGGDLPPMKRCAPEWRAKVLERLPNIRLTLLIGRYSQAWHLGSELPRTLADTIAQWRSFLPHNIVTPHPSWRNTAWLKRNPLFENEVLPELRRRVAKVLST